MTKSPQSTDLNALFRQAEAAFAAKNSPESLRIIAEIERYIAPQAALLHLKGLAQKQTGQLADARTSLLDALNLAPNDIQIRNNLANLLLELDDRNSALEHFDIVLKQAPNFSEARLNRAIALHKLHRYHQSRQDFDALVAAGVNAARLWSAKAIMEYDSGAWEAARADFDRALAINPAHVNALIGRAKLALELGEGDCVTRYEAASNAAPAERSLAIGLAQARSVQAIEGAADVLKPLLQAQPGWSEGHTVYAGILWEQGKPEEYALLFEAAVRNNPDDDALRGALAETFAGTDDFKGALTAIQCRPQTKPPNNAMAVLGASFAMKLGDDDCVAEFLKDIPDENLDAAIVRGLRSLKSGSYDEAELWFAKVRQRDPDNIAAWAYSDLGWRMSGDARHQWLHGQTGLFSPRFLELSQQEILEIADYLRDLHRTNAAPIGQSLRSGTQTRGRLLLRCAPLVRKLQAALQTAVAQHWAGLPVRDPQHPLLKHRSKMPIIDGSWSVRLTGAGFHIQHIHPNGLLSSACYFSVPAEASANDVRHGWLELGGAPAELALPIKPIDQIQPEAGKIILFPSTLFHGTTPFESGERISVAFDIISNPVEEVGASV